MASLVVNTSTIDVTNVNQNTITVNFTSDKTLTDVKLSTDGGSTYKDKLSMTQTSATFDITGMSNNTYSCKLKGFYEEAESVVVPVTGIVVDEWNISLTEGQTRQMIASVVPKDATNQNINWYSDNASAATVSTTGLISAIKAGYAKVTATTEEGNIPYDIHVNVTASSSGGSSNITVNSSYTIKPSEMLEISYTTSVNISSSCSWELRQNGSYLCSAYKDTSTGKIVCYTSSLSSGTHSNITLVAKEYKGSGYVDVATSNAFSIIVNSSSGGGDTGGSDDSISNSSETAITQQYSSSHEATPNNPSPPTDAYNWVNAPRINPDGSFPQSTWNAMGHWMTTYKVVGASYYDNVGLLLQNPMAWIWNTTTKSWDVLSDDFEWGSWYVETFWDDGNSFIAGTTTWETGESGNHSKWVKIKQTSETSGRCFHPWGYQKNWRSNSSWSNNGQPYIVTKIDFKLVKYDENGVDNLDKAQLVVNSGADWWRNVGDVWQSDWSTSRDMAVGKYILATRELKRAWCTNLPQNWSYGLPK